MNGDVAALVLAGGRGRRMNRATGKHAVHLGGQTLLDRALARVARQTSTVLLSCNDAPEGLAVPVLPDAMGGFPGPLAGILAGLEYLERHFPEVPLLGSVAVDTPWFPEDLFARLESARHAQHADIAVAVSGGRDHPVFALWRRTLAAQLRAALLEEDLRKVGAFQGRYRVARVEWPAQRFDPFFNINEPADLAQARRWCAEGML